MVYCCAVNCHQNTSSNHDKVKFFRFPARNKEQRELWIKAVNRVDVNGKPWQPSQYSRICSLHFVNGKASPTRTNPSYVPSIFHSLDDKNEESGTKQKKPEPKNKRNVKVSALIKEDRFRAAAPVSVFVEDSSTESSAPKDSEPHSDPLAIKSQKSSQYKYGGAYCCVEGCSNNQYGHCHLGIKFYRFPCLNKDKQRRVLWIKALGRRNPDGSIWFPCSSTRICSIHFESGVKSNDSKSPSYVPTIFPNRRSHLWNKIRPRTEPTLMVKSVRSMTVIEEYSNRFSPVPLAVDLKLEPEISEFSEKSFCSSSRLKPQRTADDSRSEAEIDNTESVVIKVEPDINFEEEEDDDDGNLLLDPPLQNDWDNQEKEPESQIKIEEDESFGNETPSETGQYSSSSNVDNNQSTSFVDNESFVLDDHTYCAKNVESNENLMDGLSFYNKEKLVFWREHAPLSPIDTLERSRGSKVGQKVLRFI